MRKQLLILILLISARTICNDPVRLISTDEIQIMLDQPNEQYIYLDNPIKQTLLDLDSLFVQYPWSSGFKQLIDDVKAGQSIALCVPVEPVINECLNLLEQKIVEKPNPELMNLRSNIEFYKEQIINGNALIKTETQTRSGRSDVKVFCDLLVNNCLRVNGNVVICGTLSSRIISCVQKIEVQDGNAGSPSYTFCNDDDTGIFRAGPNRLSISTNGIERATVNGVGNVGLGTPTPTEQLVITRNFLLPDTNSSGTAGVILKGPGTTTGTKTRFIHNFGTNNTFVGENSGNFSSSGANNTGLGTNTLQSNTEGVNNTAIGLSSLAANTTGNSNTSVGVVALTANLGGSANTAIGVGSLSNNTSGQINTAGGVNSLLNLQTGNTNTAFGADCASNITTGNNNIYLGFLVGNGAVPIANESNAIRIGVFNSVAPSGAQPNACFVQGINGATVNQNVAVLVGTDGKLGTAVASSRAFKKDITNIDEFSKNITKLNPVAFKYVEQINPTGETQYGLIAEEVAKFYPGLVTYDEENKPAAVKYHALNMLILNELKKLMQEVNELKQRK